MKKRLLILWIALLSIVQLTGCLLISEEPYTFCQEADQIISIEIVQDFAPTFEESDYRVIQTLEADEFQVLLDEVLDVPGNRTGMDPPTGIGNYIIKITYKDGTIELLGDFNNGYISPDGKLRQDCYVFDREAFLALISKFTD